VIVCEADEVRAERAVALAAYEFVVNEETDDTWPALKAAVEAWKKNYLDRG
jgi:hypothetical protein